MSVAFDPYATELTVEHVHELDVLHLSCLADKQTALTPKEVLQPCLDALMRASSAPVSSDDIILSAYYVDEVEGPLVISRSGTPDSISRPADITAQAGLAELCDTAVDEATACYTHITGERDLFVQAEEENDDIEDM